MPRRKIENNDVCLYQNRHKDERRKSVTPAVIRFEVQIIITVRMKKRFMSNIFVFKQQKSPSLQQIYQRPKFTTISYDHIADLQPKNRIYVPQYLLTYLCSCAGSY